MIEHTILKDLQKYLDKRGIETEVAKYQERWIIEFEILDTSRPWWRKGCWFSINSESMCKGHLTFVVSLADPQYREKFYEYLKENEIDRKRMWKSMR